MNRDVCLQCANGGNFTCPLHSKPVSALREDTCEKCGPGGEPNCSRKATHAHPDPYGFIPYCGKHKCKKCILIPLPAEIEEDWSEPEPLLAPKDRRIKAVRGEAYKHEKICIRMTAEQKQDLTAAATRAGIGVSTWMLWMALKEARQGQ